MIRLVTTAAAILLAAPALAEQHTSGPDYQAMVDFFSPAAEQAAQAVEAGEWQGVAGWMADKVQDDAPIYFAGYVVLSAGPSMNFDGSLTGEDLAAMAAMAGGPQMAMMQGLEDYDLEVDVKAAWQLPGDAVAGEVAFYESGSLPNLGSDDAARGPFSSATVCAVRLAGAEAGEPIIAIASCEVMAQL